MLLWQGVRKGKRSHDEANKEEEEGRCEGKLADEEEADEEEEGHCKGKEEESEKDEEEKEGHLIPLGKKRSQHHKSCSKKQKVDNTERKTTIYSYDSLLSHILGEKSAATIFVGNLSYDVNRTTLTTLMRSRGLEPTCVRIIRNDVGQSRGLEQ